MATLELPALLRSHAGGLARFETSAGTVAEAVAALCVAHPALRSRLFLADGSLRRSIGLFLDEDDVSDEPQRPLGPTDVVTLVAAISGG